MGKTKKTISEKDIHKNTIISSLKECLDILHNIPEPTYEVKVGDRMRYGAFDWSGVLQVCEGGKYLKLFSVTWKTKMNIPDHSHFKIHYEPWFSVVPYKDWSNEDEDRIVENDDIHFQYSQRDVYSLLNKMSDRYGIDLEPEYQRGNVWTEKQKIELIDSIFKNIDIGKFTIIRRPWGPNPNKPLTEKLYEMLDGKQRITALWEFYTCKFKYKGKYYHELHPFDRNHFRHYSISYAETEPLTKEQKYRYFLKLNTTGTPMNPDHMQKIYQMWLKEVEKNDCWNSSSSGVFLRK